MEQAEPARGKDRFINYRPLFEIAIGFGLGIALCESLKSPGGLALGAVFAVCGVILLIAGRRRPAMLLISIAAGALALLIAMPAALPKAEYRVTGTVVEYSAEKKGAELTLSKVKLNGKRFNRRLILRCKNGCSPAAIGDEIASYAAVWTPEGRFGSYNRFRALMANGIGAEAKADSFMVISHGGLPFLRFLHRIRGAVVEKAEALFKEDGGLISALTVGERKALSGERSDIYRATGTAHLLAISGFHMGVICAVMSLFLPKGRRVFRAAVMGAGMLFYCLVAVFAPGLVRSAIMTMCILICSALERRPDSLSALSLAAVIILLLNPFQLYSVGFRLSFAACFGIIMLYKPVYHCLRKLRIPFAEALAVSVCASAATVIIQMRYFGSLSTYLLLGNIVAVPAFSVILISGIIIIALGFLLPGAAAVLAVIPRAVLFAAEKYLSFLSTLPAAAVPFRSPPVIACISALAGIFFISQYVLRPVRERLKYASAAILVFTASMILSIIRL